MAVPKKYYELENLLKVEYGFNEWHEAPDNHPIMKKMKLIMVSSKNTDEEKEQKIKRLRRPRFWTTERTDYLFDNYLNETDEEIGENLGTTDVAVKNKRLSLNLTRTTKGISGNALPVVYLDDKGRENTFSSRSQLCRYLSINNYQLDKLIDKGERCWYA